MPRELEEAAPPEAPAQKGGKGRPAASSSMRRYTVKFETECGAVTKEAQALAAKPPPTAEPSC